MLKYLPVFLFILLLSLLGLYYTNSINFSPNQVRPNQTVTSIPQKHERPQEIIIVVVVCEDRTEEALTMLKSALISTAPQQPIHFIVFADAKLAPHINETTLLDKVDSLLYMDSDTLFMVPPATVWNHFSHMNNSQMAALAPEHEDFNTGWYNRFARIPYYGPLGVNTGVMLMNLTRMRAFKWEDYVVSIYHQYKLNITWGDQDIINVIFHYHPDKLYVYPCHYNYRTDHCKYMSGCHAAEKDGVAVLHGSRSVFHNKGHLAFQAIYNAFKEFELGSDSDEYLLTPMKKYLEGAASTNCGQLKAILIKNLETTIQERTLKRSNVSSTV